MVGKTKIPETSLPELDEGNLINQIEELEKLLDEKKLQKTILPRLNVGTDGIPVLVKAVTEERLNLEEITSSDTTKNHDRFINDIIDKQ